MIIARQHAGMRGCKPCASSQYESVCAPTRAKSKIVSASARASAGVYGAVRTAEDALHLSRAVIHECLHESSRLPIARAGHLPLVFSNKFACPVHDIIVLVLSGNLGEPPKFKTEGPDFGENRLAGVFAFELAAECVLADGQAVARAVSEEEEEGEEEVCMKSDWETPGTRTEQVHALERSNEPVCQLLRSSQHEVILTLREVVC